MPKETKGKSIAKKKDQGKELPSKSDDNPLEAGDYNCILSILIMSKSAIGSPLIYEYEKKCVNYVGTYYSTISWLSCLNNGQNISMNSLDKSYIV